MTFSSDLVASGDVRPKARIFISYSRKDLAFVDRLDAALKARGFEPLIDRDQIYAFEPWWERIQALIMEADTIIFVLSPSAVLSETCAKEVSFAASLHKRFAPVVCERVEGSVPEPLRRLNYIFCDDNARFDASVDQLVDALSTDIDWFRKHTEFGTMARRWEAAGKPSPHGLLLRSPVLEEVENWIASRPPRAPEPTLTTREFISESRKQENALIAAARDARKRKRRLELALFGMLILTSVLGIVYALWTNFDYLKVRGEMLVDQFWSKILTVELEQRYAQSNLQPGEIIRFRECIRCPEMVIVSAGEFMMGSPASERGRLDNEGPQYKVTISKAFAVSMFEVTFDEWKACVDARACENTIDNRWGRGNRPVINVSWDDAKQYVKWISERTGKPYRLLSEAEWEYAARASSTTAFAWGDDIGSGKANCIGCGSNWDSKQTAPVRSFDPNKFGVYDMHGNVMEWVEDCKNLNYVGAPTDGSARTDGDCAFRALRGGSWYASPQNLRSAYRNWYPADAQDNALGFRLARTLVR